MGITWGDPGDLGKLLRECREIAGLSIGQAASEMRTDTRFLQALEAEDFDTVTKRSPGFIQSILKGYAGRAGKDPQKLINLYEDLESDYNSGDGGTFLDDDYGQPAPPAKPVPAPAPKPVAAPAQASPASNPPAAPKPAAPPVAQPTVQQPAAPPQAAKPTGPKPATPAPEPVRPAAPPQAAAPVPAVPAPPALHTIAVHTTEARRLYAGRAYNPDNIHPETKKPRPEMPGVKGFLGWLAQIRKRDDTAALARVDAALAVAEAALQKITDGMGADGVTMETGKVARLKSKMAAHPMDIDMASEQARRLGALLARYDAVVLMIVACNRKATDKRDGLLKTARKPFNPIFSMQPK